MSQELLIWGIGLPVLLFTGVLMAVYRPWSHPAASAEGWAGANALAAAFAAAYLVVRDWKVALPPRQPWEWLAYVVIAVAIAVGYGAPVGGRGKSAWVVWLLAACLSAYVIVDIRVEQSWAWRMMVAAMMVGSISALDRMQERMATPVFAIMLCLVAAAGCLVLVEWRQETLARLVGALAACLGVAALLGWWRPSMTLGSGGVLVAGLLLPGLVMSGYFSGKRLDAWYFVLASLAPAAYWLTEIPFVQQYVARGPQAVRVGAVVGVGAVAAVASLIVS